MNSCASQCQPIVTICDRCEPNGFRTKACTRRDRLVLVLTISPADLKPPEKRKSTPMRRWWVFFGTSVKQDSDLTTKQPYEHSLQACFLIFFYFSSPSIAHRQSLYPSTEIKKNVCEVLQTQTRGRINRCCGFAKLHFVFSLAWSNGSSKSRICLLQEPLHSLIRIALISHWSVCQL